MSCHVIFWWINRQSGGSSHPIWSHLIFSHHELIENGVIHGIERPLMMRRMRVITVTKWYIRLHILWPVVLSFSSWERGNDINRLAYATGTTIALSLSLWLLLPLPLPLPSYCHCHGYCQFRVNICWCWCWCWCWCYCHCYRYCYCYSLTAYCLSCSVLSCLALSSYSFLLYISQPSYLLSSLFYPLLLLCYLLDALNCD